ncbi:UPF0454 protein C12orf49 homolog [Tetranychus urticae]|nr:UPF0454 protein C12orf49 homolog [Tetranychus urticae]XP_015782228.1 UPF0454 protein C12orf49 homolog [Tetranychus urticae]
MIKPMLRLLRRKSVLFFILLSSFTYSMVMLLRKPVNRMHFDEDSDDALVDIDRVKSRLISFRRNMYKVEINDGSGTQSAPNINFINEIDIHRDESQMTESTNLNVKKTETCRNSVQGKVLIADDKGYICARHDLTSGGCCPTSNPTTKRYSCETCNSSGCCAIFEYCISCCMEPDKKPLLQQIIANGGSPSVGVLFASITDHFEFCLTKCRTSSQSVQHENSYRDPRAKHCYGEGKSVANSKKEENADENVVVE